MSADSELVAALASGILPRSVSVAAKHPGLPLGEIPIAEAEAVEAAVLRRRVEFHAGRDAARRAMQAAGHAHAPIPMAPDRAPIWPDGLVGSITHTNAMCLAVVAPATALAGIGIDLEHAEALPSDLLEEVTTSSERDWLRTQPTAERGVMARLIFSAKEAAYKAQYPISRRLFGFETFEVDIDRATCAFTARFTSAHPPFVQDQKLAGFYHHAAGVLVTAVTIGHDEIDIGQGR